MSMSASAAAIPEKLFFKIGEVCDIAGVQAHVLRYWETEVFPCSSRKRPGRPAAPIVAATLNGPEIKELLYDEQYTIAGAKKKLAANSGRAGRVGS